MQSPVASLYVTQSPVAPLYVTQENKMNNQTIVLLIYVNTFTNRHEIFSIYTVDLIVFDEL